MLRTSMQSLDSSLNWDTSQATMKVAAEMMTPRPTPQFFNQAQIFSTKKERGVTPRDCQPPRPPVKSAPPISRIFPNKVQQRAQYVSFKSSDNSILSPHYNEDRKDLYFNQCFKIESKLGEGSFGEVFKVRSKEDGKLYAIKRSRERFRGESDRKRKLEEVAKHEKLPKHPNCVRFIKAWEERQHLYIQTELCDSSLNNYAENNHNIPERLIWNYLVDLLMAVKHLHDHDLVHMDIKPENIFISENLTCKLGDFGLVIDLTKNVDYSEAQEGDPKYLAPELMNGQFGKPADIFSIGITILELASDLDLPRGGDLWHSLRSGHLPDKFLAGLSPELNCVIRVMMQPNPKIRPTVNEILESPIVKRIWKRRRRQQAWRTLVSFWHAMWQGFWGLLATLFLTMTYPLHNVLPTVIKTPEKSTTTYHNVEWDHSFSDDDAFDEEINISNNSMGVPLNCSSSSEESFNMQDHSSPNNFLSPRALPMRKAFTTPGLGSRRPFRLHTPVSSGSPCLSSTRYTSSSGVSSPLLEDNHLNSSGTPNSSFGLHHYFMEEHTKIGIEPKNLLDAFEISDDGD